MRTLKVMLIATIALAMVCATAFAVKHLPEERGKAHFKNPNFAQGKKACNSCHPNGRGLDNAGTKKKFRIMGKTQNSLEEAVNFCIVNANKGKAIPEDSKEMKDIVTYIKSLGRKAAPGYGAPAYGDPGYGAPSY
jgi:cytochrome c